MAESVNRVVLPSVSVDRAVAVDRERDREGKKRGAAAPQPDGAKESVPPPAEPEEDAMPVDPKKGKALDIKV